MTATRSIIKNVLNADYAVYVRPSGNVLPTDKLYRIDSEREQVHAFEGRVYSIDSIELLPRANCLMVYLYQLDGPRRTCPMCEGAGHICTPMSGNYRYCQYCEGTGFKFID